MKPMKAYTHINRMVGLAPLVLFLSSYLPLFLIIIIRQMITNAEFLEWGGFNIEAIICMVRNFGMSIFCFLLSIFGSIGTYLLFNNLNHNVENGQIYKLVESSSINDEPLAYMATYIIPLMFEDYGNIVDFITVILIFYIVYRLYVRSRLLLVNPILNLKFSIYNIKYEDNDIIRQGLLITKSKDILEGDFVKIYNVGHQLFYGYKR